MKYRILVEVTAEELQASINRAENNGWTPVGGIAVAMDWSKIRFRYEQTWAVLISKPEA